MAFDGTAPELGATSAGGRAQLASLYCFGTAAAYRAWHAPPPPFTRRYLRSPSRELVSPLDARFLHSAYRLGVYCGGTEPIQTRMVPCSPANPRHAPMPPHPARPVRASNLWPCSRRPPSQHMEMSLFTENSRVARAFTSKAKRSLKFRTGWDVHNKMAFLPPIRSVRSILVAAGIYCRARVPCLPTPTTPKRPRAGLRFSTLICDETLTQFRGRGTTPAGNDMRRGSGSTGAS